MAQLSMPAAQSNQLLTDRTTAVGLSLTGLCVADNPLHFMAAWKAAVGVPTLAGVHQGLDAALDGQLPSLLNGKEVIEIHN